MKNVKEIWRKFKAGGESWGKLRKVEQCDWIAVWEDTNVLRMALELTPNATGEKSIENFGAAKFSELILKKTFDSLSIILLSANKAELHLSLSPPLEPHHV